MAEVRHKKKLDQIREDHKNVGTSSDRGYPSSSIDQDGPTYGPTETVDRLDGVGTPGIESQPGVVGGLDSRSGLTDTSLIDNNSSVYKESDGQSLIQPKDMQAEKERKRELARQRKARQRSRENLTDTPDVSSKPGRDSDIRDEKPVAFQLKPGLLKSQSHEETKVFSQKEADEQLQKLIFVYQRGSEILDDILEIVVKGHEKIQIWALSDDEASMFATMQMERAKKDKSAAKAVRTLISIYDRMYLFMLVGPRIYATGQHVKAQGGISFK